MPFILEGLWLLAKLWFGLFVLLENRRTKWTDPQLEALRHQGAAYQQLAEGRYLELLTALSAETAQQSPKPGVAHWLRAQAWYHLGHYPQCLAACDAALQADLYNSHVYHLRAQALYALGRVREALEMCDYALRLATANGAVHTLRATCLAQLGTPAPTPPAHSVLVPNT